MTQPLKTILGFGLIFFLFSFDTLAQAPKKLNAAEIKAALNKLEVLGSVLYIAAHPDDENTRLIAYMSNEKKLRTGYLAMTRGDGGQNLIGTEIREYLGIIRTQELLAARRRDGGEQFFTRANDFGFSKSPEETFNFWDKEAVLADMVWTIRRFQPDIMITRFDTARVPGGRMHGHHTASALLAMEAFHAAADPKVFPEQLKLVDPWQPKGLYWNTYNFRRSSTNYEGVEGYYTFDLGVYNPLLGKSYDEISAESRSQHKSQGFGSTGRRGTLKEHLKHWKGESPENDIFEDIDLSWGRVKGGNRVGDLLRKANASFNMEKPSEIAPLLMEARKELLKLEGKQWKQVKLKELDLVIKSVLGLYLEVTARSYSAVPGDEVVIAMEAINRSPVTTGLKKVVFPGLNVERQLDINLPDNEVYRKQDTLFLPKQFPFSQPYWLEDEASEGMYTVKNQEMIGLAENPAPLEAIFHLEINGVPYEYSTAIVFKRNDPVDGESYRPFVVTPPVFVNIREQVLVFPDHEPKEVTVLVKAGQENISGKVRLDLPPGWQSNPEEVPYTLAAKNEEQLIAFQVLPPETSQEAYIGVTATSEGQIYDKGLKEITHDHVPTQTIFPRSRTKVVKVDLEKIGHDVGYIMGAGDAIPESLAQVGYRVTILDPNEITAESLVGFDAVILGIRAYNTVDRLRFIQPELMAYVRNGGTMITQYNTSFRLVTKDLAPYPLQLSRERVTVEEAKVSILAPDHPVINGPNKITASDFEGWVQERGLYFPNEWDERFTPILSSNDPRESPKKGGLLVADYGEGHFIYTGYSWFRQLPAGVPGAFRIFTNMISIGKEKPKNAALNVIENNK